MSSEEKRIAQITGDVLKLNKKKVKGSELTFFLIARNEHGAEVELPIGSEEMITIKVKISGGMKQVRQYGGSLQVKAANIETVIAQSEVHVNARSIGNLVANQTTLGNTQEIGTCFAGCIGAHVNEKQQKITVRKSSRNPFEEDCPLEINQRLREHVEIFQEMRNKDKSI
jgi:hypothetical protein